MNTVRNFLTVAVLCFIIVSLGRPVGVGAKSTSPIDTPSPLPDTGKPPDTSSPLGPDGLSLPNPMPTTQPTQSNKVLLTSGSSCGIKILIDQGHRNYYSLSAGDQWSYSGFVAALAAQGYDVDSTTSSLITYEALAPYAAYIIPLAQNAPTSQEIQAMQQYVQNGGGLFLIADWGGTFSSPSQALASVFGVTLDANTVTDPADYIEGYNYWVTYANANFSSHIIMQGLTTLQTYASTSLQPGTASPLITTDADATPPNRAIAAALNYGTGRVVILGDSNYFDDMNGRLNVGGNKQFGMNITNWLARKSNTPSSDRDGDGLLNGIETAGWTNTAGHFTTNPDDADSDDDGLVDGEEKLFDTNPNDDTSPGIYVVYGDNLKTKEYFSWNKHGSQYIALSSAVVRRGAIFSVGGPKGANLQVTKSTSSLTTLAPTRDACSGRWDFSIGSNNTAGEYTITLTKGSWNKNLKLYVIFELPSDLDQPSVHAFLYNDNEDDNKDNTSIWFATGEEEYWKWIFLRRHKANGFGLTFTNDQYQPYVFTYVMEAINGTSSQNSAAQKLAEKLDELTRFDASVSHNTMYDVLHSYDMRNQCSNIANALVSLSRSAGIAARPVMVDWDGTITGSGKFDHAAEVWLSGEWKTMRAYNVSQGGEDSPQPVKGGIVSPTDTRTWGTEHYPDSYSDIIVVAGSSWNSGDMSNFDGANWKKVYVWDNDSPNNIQRREWLQTRATPYWGWSSEPTRTGDPSLLAMTAGGAVLAGTYSDRKIDSNMDGSAEVLAVEAGIIVTSTGNYGLDADLFDSEGQRVSANAQSYLNSGNYTMTLNFRGDDLFRNGVNGPYHIGFTLSSQDDGILLGQEIYTTTNYLYTEFQTPTVYFTNQYTDLGLDTDGNGSLDYLALRAEVNALSPGYYSIVGTLADNGPDLSAIGGDIASSKVYTYLTGGVQTVQLLFDGRTSFMERADGPYKVKELFIADVENPTPEELSGHLIDYRHDVYTTTAYNYAAFENPGAYFTDQYTDSGIDNDSNGKYEYLAVNVGLGISTSGSYTVTGELCDSAGNVLGAANWSGSATTAQLRFDGQSIHRNAVNGQYHLKNLHLLNSAGEIIASVNEAYVTASYLYTQFAGVAAALTGVYSDYRQDINSNGLYDYLVVDVQVSVSEAGEYLIEGWLADKNNHLVTWASSGSSSLSVGLHHFQLRFDGEAIQANGVSGVFTVSGLKVLKTTGYVVLDETDATTSTASYDYTSFEGTSPESGVVFLDDGEGGTGKWIADYPWSLVTVSSHSPSHSWTDSPGASYTNNANVSLTSVNMNLSVLTNPVLSFWTHYATEAGADYCYIEVSTDGGRTWTNVATYTGIIASWTNEQVSLSNFAGIANLKLRFRLFSNGSVNYDGWSVDDVKIFEGPRIQGGKIHLPLILRDYHASISDPYEPNNTLTQAYGPLASGTTYLSYLSSDTDYDYYYFDIATLGQVTVDLSNIGAPSSDYDLYLYNSSGQWLSYSAGVTTTEQIKFQPATTGRYYVEVYSYSGVDATRPYYLKVQYNGALGAGDVYGTVYANGSPKSNAPITERLINS